MTKRPFYPKGRRIMANKLVVCGLLTPNVANGGGLQIQGVKGVN
jgi:hypothetical protein